MAGPSNLVVRVLTALVGAPIILGLLYFGPPVGFFALTTAATAVASYELFGMSHPDDRGGRVLGVALSLVVSVVAFFFGGDARVLLTLIALLPIVAFFITLARLGEIPTAGLRAMALGMGPLYVGLPLALLAAMRRDVGGNAGAGFVVLSLLLAWFADTGGYFAGRFLGKHKLYEAVSPKKTVEGAIGGLAAAVLGALLASFWFLPSLPVMHGVVLAIVGGAAGQAGDLAESLLKRSTGVKDSGAILPGHGGILDRVDALLVTSTVTFLYVLWAAPR
ncbi:MAG: phosphatidate cytidylyltransferase [Polyangiaceae bacterium]